ncbi:pollen-specific leucine-rich repeat extensin-like protein 2 [Acanthaster planci]|uniref:Pollen-specific leucine-rich repeat extensin-like protein 2 n=1 Tax=Acanthaster planci TaxID=133434 RepID=A0A8B7Y3X2_ACAPL|nr:pollen-specific leucine-rich repeat extensin-like protein 2 [Acanthaster planci]XP_022087021.1 pollen-specific leucine-rich repeat extensin-like protein 2 [Acanthaster planci]
MAYKQGVALGASVSLFLGSVALLGMYLACSSVSCQAVGYSFASPIWTSVLILATALVGIFMSATKSEKGCGGLFLFLSIFGMLATMACVCTTINAYVWEMWLSLWSSGTYWTYNTTEASTTTLEGSTPVGNGVGIVLWLAMMIGAFVLCIVTCVTSYQYCCCCQEPWVVQERIILVNQGNAACPQNIVLENTNTIVNQQAPQPVVFTTLPPGGGQFVHQQQFPVQQPYHQPVQLNQPPSYPQPVPPPYAAVGTAPVSQPSPVMAPPPVAQPSAPPAPQATPTGAFPPQSGPAQPQPAPTNLTLSHPLPPSAAEPGRPGPSNNITVISDGGPPPSTYQPLIHETQTRAPDIQHTYDQTAHTGDDNMDYTYIDAQSPGTNMTAHRSNYDRAPAPSPTAGSGNDPQGDSDINSRLYAYVDDPSEDYDEIKVDSNVYATAPVESSDYVNEDVGKRPKTRNPKKSK